MNQANCFIYSVHYALQYGSMVRIVSDLFPILGEYTKRTNRAMPYFGQPSIRNLYKKV